MKHFIVGPVETYKEVQNIYKQPYLYFRSNEFGEFVKETLNRVLREGKYNFASDTGNYDVNSDEWKTNYDRMSNDYREQEKKYQSKTQDLVQQITASKENYHTQLLAIERSYANRLQQSESRANLYSQMSRDSDSSREYLAHYTAKLDRTIVEGRQLVTELKAIIELRDEQLRQCGEQLKLMEKAYGRAEATK